MLLKYNVLLAVLALLQPLAWGQARCMPEFLPFFEDYEGDFEWSNGWSNNSVDTSYWELDHCWVHGFSHYSGWRSMTTFEYLGSAPPYERNKVMEIQKAFWLADGEEAGEEYAATPPLAESPALLTFRAYYPLAYINPEHPGGRYRDTSFADGVPVAVGYCSDFHNPLESFVALDTVRVTSRDGHAKTLCCSDLGGGAVPPRSRLMFRVVQPMDDWKGVVTVYVDSVSLSRDAMPSDTIVLRDTLCVGYPYRGHGFALDTLWTMGTRLLGRDSVADCHKYHLRLWLDVFPPVHKEYYEILIKGDSLRFADSVIHAPGVYYFHYTTNRGCDSTVVLHVVNCKPKLCVAAVRDYLDYDHPVLTLQNCNDSVVRSRWTFSDGHEAVGSRVSHALSHPLPDSVEVTLVAYDRQGCIADTTMSYPLRVVSVWFPNAFTPDGDANRTFGCTTTMEAADFSLTVYNRHGLMVWSTRRVEEQWDGTRGGTPMPQGAYVYVWHLRGSQGEYKEGLGTVMLLR